jgi:hypothetical protein
MTVIELLVVIAVIAILAALVLPIITIGHSRPHLTCHNRLRQIALAASLYASDHKGRFPNLDQQPGNDGPAVLLLLTPYLQNRTDIFICPGVAMQREKGRGWFGKRFVPSLDRAFFQSNGNDYAFYDGLSNNIATNMLLADRFAWTNRSMVNSNLLNHPDGRVSLAFSDGHAEWAKRDRVIGTNLTPNWSALQDPIRRP